jgi:fatty acid/phospholipid biosynthesis enzyme
MRLNKKCDDAVMDGNLVVKISEATVSLLRSNITKSTTSKKYRQMQYGCNCWSCKSMCSKKAHKQLDGKSEGIVCFAKRKLVGTAKPSVFIAP